MKISVQSQDLVDDLGIQNAYRMIKNAGFEAIDWSLDHAWKFKDLLRAERLENLSIFEKSQDEILAYYREELDAIRENGLAITQAHAPFPAYEPGRPDILEYAIRIYKNMILFCDTVGCPRLIIHGITKQERNPNATPADIARLNDKLYESLIPALQSTKNVTVCLENLFTNATELHGHDFWEGHCSDPHLAVEIIDRLNEKAGKVCFGLCLDTGHLNLLRKPFHSYVPILGKRICALHIHDNSQLNDSHMMPYTGTVRWDDFLKEMKAIGYDKDLSFETFAQTQKSRLPKALLPTFLRSIADIGNYFREELQGFHA